MRSSWVSSGRRWPKAATLIGSGLEANIKIHGLDGLDLHSLFTIPITHSFVFTSIFGAFSTSFRGSTLRRHFPQDCPFLSARLLTPQLRLFRRAEASSDCQSPIRRAECFQPRFNRNEGAPSAPSILLSTGERLIALHSPESSQPQLGADLLRQHVHTTAHNRPAIWHRAMAYILQSLHTTYGLRA